MNKRIRKKRDFENRLRVAENTVSLLMSQNILLWKCVEDMEALQSTNVEAANKRFEQLESKDKSLRVALDEAVIKIKKNQKKSWFGRK